MEDIMSKQSILLKLFAAAVISLMSVQTVLAETLRVGMECTYAPFNFKNADGDLDGYDVDVAKGVAELIDADLEFVCQKWDGMIPALLANKFDIVVASMSITEKRLEKMDFSDTYRISVGRLVGKKDSGWNLFDDAGKPIAANFAGLKVGLERATTYSDWFESVLPEADVVLYDTNEALYLDLVNGRTDMIMTNPMKAHLRFLSKEDGAGFEFVSPQIDEPKYFGIGVGIGLRQGNDELKARLNAAIKTLTDDGSLEKYALKYFPFAIH
ncbi:MAG: transporter substrate-binding domain-containing protein [Gammaproteobacteria bacterium]|nr:transporter substrate-binding domain-containing protein [Gammaproteobacteria bacterium]